MFLMKYSERCFPNALITFIPLIKLIICNTIDQRDMQKSYLLTSEKYIPHVLYCEECFIAERI